MKMIMLFSITFVLRFARSKHRHEEGRIREPMAHLCRTPSFSVQRYQTRTTVIPMSTRLPSAQFAVSGRYGLGVRERKGKGCHRCVR